MRNRRAMMTAVLPEAPECPVCRGCNTRYWRSGEHKAVKAEDVRISDDRYGRCLALWRCNDCEYAFASGASQTELNQAYEAMEDEGYIQGEIYRLMQQRRILHRTMRVMGRMPANLLDIGCGTGLMLMAAKEMGIDGTGVEPSLWAVDQAKRRGLDARHGYFPNSGICGEYELITLVDIIEHLTQPAELLEAAAKQLSRIGMIVAITPDVNSIASRLMGPRWWHCRMAHVGFHTQRSLSKMAFRAGLEIVTIERPKWFFSVDYLLARLVRYLPPFMCVRASKPAKENKGLLSTVVPINLFDSLCVYMAKKR